MFSQTLKHLLVLPITHKELNCSVNVYNINIFSMLNNCITDMTHSHRLEVDELYVEPCLLKFADNPLVSVEKHFNHYSSIHLKLLKNECKTNIIFQIGINLMNT